MASAAFESYAANSAKISLKAFVLTESKKIKDKYHNTVITEKNRLARIIVPQKFAECLKKNTFIKMLNIRYASGQDEDYIRLEVDSKIFSGSTSFKFDERVAERYFNEPAVDYDVISSSPAKRRLSASGKVVYVSPIKREPFYTRQEVRTSDNAGKQLISCLWDSKVVPNLALGSTIMLKNMETTVYQDKVQLKSTTETEVLIVHEDDQVNITIDGSYEDTDHYVIVDKNDVIYRVKKAVYLDCGMPNNGRITASVVNGEIIAFDVMSEDDGGDSAEKKKKMN